MKALVLEKVNELVLKEVAAPEEVGANDVKIKIQAVGICGSDVHYLSHGRIGHFIVEKPMILGHEAAGVITAVGANVKHLKEGDRVCMEPGVPQPQSPETMEGIYNLDPDVQFWATPPYDGCCSEYVVHPAAFTFKIPEHMSYAEGAMVEPLAIGMQAATKANIKPGDIGLVYGAGTIGVMCALSALASGCAEVIVVDVVDEKLATVNEYQGITVINSLKQDVAEVIAAKTAGRGVNVVFECCGVESVITTICQHAAPNGTVVLVGMPVEPVKFDIVAAQVKEITFKTIFRYANMYPKTINLISSGKLNVKPLISKTYKFEDSLEAYARALEANPSDVKIMIEME
ncbi:NAD(P)-dependent alcohol dehydrogenase [Shewanella schlegeliana]|uniref:NAD(P)-dependent alcohol dehydrogenase n=1 Tax=Shewanella schlegeliana TaxID=190308 RepID=A0ABS1SVP2_9GAMM|nr:NAD(P)-dependent alcohol dehydrogenase [Shewanella schlegeliana]MBL4912095.1 NAD(P)-dependent alcohol dehydrogenase [Shewanella schlegeliana]MCL1111307.1 NAD(P)-dependent alcohol dehydrogenase [Shewanella schlegeliana]GIU32957.1 putative D-xylulose reductase [Shewanella schlegeliana]